MNSNIIFIKINSVTIAKESEMPHNTFHFLFLKSIFAFVRLNILKKTLMKRNMKL